MFKADLVMEIVVEKNGHWGPRATGLKREVTVSLGYRGGKVSRAKVTKSSGSIVGSFVVGREPRLCDGAIQSRLRGKSK